MDSLYEVEEITPARPTIALSLPQAGRIRFIYHLQASLTLHLQIIKNSHYSDHPPRAH